MYVHFSAHEIKWFHSITLYAKNLNLVHIKYKATMTWTELNFFSLNSIQTIIPPDISFPV